MDSPFCRVVYYLCVFSMVVPFQMLMFTQSKTADTLGFNTPWTIPVIYLGFVKGIPLDIEEAAAIDGCSPMRTFFSVVLPMMKPTLASVIIFYLTCQKHIIKGVAAGAVKGCFCILEKEVCQ